MTEHRKQLDKANQRKEYLKRISILSIVIGLIIWLIVLLSFLLKQAAYLCSVNWVRRVVVHTIGFCLGIKLSCILREWTEGRIVVWSSFSLHFSENVPIASLEDNKEKISQSLMNAVIRREFKFGWFPPEAFECPYSRHFEYAFPWGKLKRSPRQTLKKIKTDLTREIAALGDPLISSDFKVELLMEYENDTEKTFRIDEEIQTEKRCSR